MSFNYIYLRYNCHPEHSLAKQGGPRDLQLSFSEEYGLWPVRRKVGCRVPPTCWAGSRISPHHISGRLRSEVPGYSSRSMGQRSEFPDPENHPHGGCRMPALHSQLSPYLRELYRYVHFSDSEAPLKHAIIGSIFCFRPQISLLLLLNGRNHQAFSSALHSVSQNVSIFLYISSPKDRNYHHFSRYFIARPRTTATYDRQTTVRAVFFLP